VDTGDFVVVTNAEKVRITGRKEENRMIRWHTGWMGHLRGMPLSKFRQLKPEEVVRMAVRRMLPKTKLGKKMFSKLKVYRGVSHPHAAQSPEPLSTLENVYASCAR
jgi:large subunit ribosomal protein L13